MFTSMSYSKLPSSQRGLSLVELMISLTIGLILLAGITSLIVKQSATRDELEKSSRQIENGRYATQLLRDDIQHAGFLGPYLPQSGVPATADPCELTLAGLQNAMTLPIQGVDVAPGSVLTGAQVLASNTCGTYIPSANYKTGTDILVVRRANTSVTPMATATANAGGLVYLQATPSSFVLGKGSDTSVFTLTSGSTATPVTAALRSYIVNIYFVSPCSVMANGATCTSSDDNGTPIPTLKRLELGALNNTTTWSVTPLVEGIENMQIDYGIDSDSDGYPNTYTTSPANTTDWSNVMAIRVNILARNNTPSMGYTDTKTYCLSGSPPFTASGSSTSCNTGGTMLFGPMNDAYKRHLFSEMIRAVNPSGRRAQH
jgi:type IV pilus assembly protein PilW